MSEKKIFNMFLYRDSYTVKSTLGKLYLGNDYFCETLEDVVRGKNIKIFRETSIPEGVYDVKINLSSRFKRLMPILSTEANGYEIKRDGVYFKGVRMHAGWTHRNTAGCILLGYKRVSKDEIDQSAEEDLTKTLREVERQGYQIKLYVVNMPQTE